MARLSTSRPARRERSHRHAPEEARLLIERAALRFLARRPFRDLTVGRLMTATELSRPAFYQYFRDLHELMEALLGGVVTRLGALANPWLAGEGDPEAALRVALRGVVQVGVESGSVLRAVAEAAPADARLERGWASFMGHWDDVVSARIEAQQAEGLIPPFDARAMAKALNALDAAVVIREFGRRPHADPELVLDTLYRLWAGALYGHSRAPKDRTRQRKRGTHER